MTDRVNIVRKCDACGQEDEHPQHMIDGGAVRHPVLKNPDGSPVMVDLSVGRHWDCCAATGCPTCTTDLEFFGPKQGAELQEALKNRSPEHFQALFDRHGCETPGYTRGPTTAVEAYRSQRAAALVTVEANAWLNASSATSAYTAPTTPIKVQLNSAVGSASAAGTQISGGSYTSQTLTMAAAAAESASSNVALTYTNMPAVTVTSVDEFDSAGTPIRRWWGSLTASKTTNSGDTFSIASGSYTKTAG